MKPNERPPTDAGGMSDTLDERDAGDDAGMDAANAVDTGGADADVDAGPILDIYVDVKTGSPLGTGAPDAPLKTITQALAIAVGGATIHAASGTYDESAGETFPLVLRGVSLVGTESDPPTIRGSGFYEVDASAWTNNQYPTLVIGDNVASARVRGVVLQPAPGVSSQSSEAIWCDRGTAPTGGASKTRVEKITIGADYAGYGIVSTGTHDPNAAPSGCNLVCVGSTISAGANVIGIVVAGGNDAALTSVLLGGPNQGDGNTFHGVGVNSTGVNFMIRAAGTNVVEGNTFDGGDYGIIVSREGMKVVIRSNTFQRLAHGVTVGYSVVDELSGNRFIKNTADAISGARLPSYGLGLDGNTGPPEHYGQVITARRNTFLSNDVGVYLLGQTTGVVTSRASNFGDVSSAGGNVFRCNGTAVRIDATFGAALPFIGNGWDRKPPNVVMGGTEPANTDVFSFTTGWPGVATDAPYQATDTCP